MCLQKVLQYCFPCLRKPSNEENNHDDRRLLEDEGSRLEDEDLRLEDEDSLLEDDGPSFISVNVLAQSLEEWFQWICRTAWVCEPTPGVQLLENLPDVPLKRVLDHLHGKEILSLRKVSRRLRNFVDNNPPDIALYTISIKLPRQRRMQLFIESPEGRPDSFGNRFKTQYSITYEQLEHVCSVERRNHWDPSDCMMVFIPNENYRERCFKNLALILKFQKSTLDIFETDFCGMKYSDESIADIYSRLEAILQPNNKPVRAVSVKLQVTNQTQALQVLNYVNPSTVKSVELSRFRGLNETVEIGEVMKLPLWSQVSEMIIGFETSEPLKSFLHFKKCDLFVEDLTKKYMTELRNVFLEPTCTMKRCIIRYRSAENRFTATLGRTMMWGDKVTSWVLKTPSSNRSVKVEWVEFDTYIRFEANST